MIELNDEQLGIPFITPLCKVCVHLLPDGVACTPFPAGIPTDILSGEILHTQKYPGQTTPELFSPVGKENE